MNRKQLIGLVAVIAAIGLFHAAGIRSGHVWGDDFALYLLHAKNLVSGTPYGDTGYIHNPHLINYSPRYYPPVYPALLALVYNLGSGDLYALKLLQVCTLTLGLLAAGLYFRGAVQWRGLVAIVAIVGLNPEWWDRKDAIASDFAFLARSTAASSRWRLSPAGTRTR